MSQDLEHLRLLSIFHYVVAAMAGLFSLFPVLHLAMGLGMVTGRFPDAQSADETVAFVGWFFVAFALLWIVAGLGFTVCMALAGRFLGQQRHYVFCLVMAALACMFMPFGTVLGVFTILVLVRPSVKELFGYAPAPPSPVA